MSAGERRHKEREDMRARIADAALELFLTEGYERTSMRRIADAVQYSPGTLYSYFEDKDEILLVLHNQAFERLYATLKQADAVEDPFEALFRCGELYLQFALENPRLYDLMFIMDATGNRIQQTNEWRPGLRSYDLLRRRVYAAMRAGRLPSANPEAVAFSMWASVHGLAALAIRHRCPMFPAEVLPAILRSAYVAAMDGWRKAALADANAAAFGAATMLPPFVELASLDPSAPAPVVPPVPGE